MGFFDQDPNADPTRLYPWLGMAQAFGQMAMPTRFKTPIGAVLGAGAGGWMQGRMAAQDYGLKNQEMGIKQQQMQQLGLQNAMQLASTNLFRQMAGLPEIQMPGGMSLPTTAQPVMPPPAANVTPNQPPAAPMGVPGGNLDYNIGNVRTGGGNWQGVGAPQNGFEVPNTPDAGVRMNAINLKTLGQQLGPENFTIANIASKWAPAGDGNNDPVSWMNTVSQVSGLPADVPINLSDPKQYASLMRGMNVAEKGKQTVPDSAYANGVNMAMTGQAPPQAPMQPGGQPQNVGYAPGMAPQAPMGVPGGPLGFLSPYLARLGFSPQEFALLQILNPKYAETVLSKALPDVMQKLNQGGTMWQYDAATGGMKLIAQAPILGEGQRVDAQGNAQIVPGYLPNMAAIDLTKRGVQATMTPQEVTNPDGSKSYVTQAQVLAQAQGNGQPPPTAPGNPPAAGAPPAATPPAAAPFGAGIGPGKAAELQEKGKDLGQLPQKLADDANSARQQNFLIDQLREESKNFNLGWGQDMNAKMRSVLAGIGQGLRIDVSGIQKTQGSYEAFNKDAMQMTMKAVRDVSGRAAVQEFQMIQKSLPNPEMTPDGFGLVTNQLYAVNDFKLAKQQAAQAWQANHGNSLNGFEADWNMRITPGAFYFLRLSPDQQQSLIGNMQGSPEGVSFLKRLRGEIDWGRQQGLFGAQ